MKKIVKMSLVAAVAVAGLTAANAKPLEEAIKDVDVSGTVVYRYNDYNENDGASTQENNYKIGLNLKSKVNDDVKLNTRFIVGSQNSAGNDGGFVSLGNAATSAADTDANASIYLSQVYFGYTGIANTTVNVGKQGLATPWTVAEDSDGNEQTGTGIVALSTVGPVTFAAAYFNQTNLGTSGQATGSFNGNERIAAVAALGSVGPVALDAWYLDADQVFDTYTVGAKASFDVASVKLGADVRYTDLSLDAANSPDNNLFKVTLTAKAGIFDAKYIYGTTDKEGGLTALDNDATSTILTWNITTNAKADADLHHVSAGVQALDTVHVSANYTTVDYIAGVNDKEQDELYAQVVYNMSKNLSSYVRFGTFSEETDGREVIDQDYRGRLQVQYSF